MLAGSNWPIYYNPVSCPEDRFAAGALPCPEKVSGRLRLPGLGRLLYPRFDLIRRITCNIFNAITLMLY